MGPEETTERGPSPANRSVSGDGGLLLVGCGKMGGALLRGWLEGGYSEDEIIVIEPSRASSPRMRAGSSVIARSAFSSGSP